MRSKYSTHVVKWFRMMNTERGREREGEREMEEVPPRFEVPIYTPSLTHTNTG
jgi:hypothetical protein